MRLRPSIPVIELLISPLLVFFSIKFFLLGLDKHQAVVLAVALLLLLIALGTIYWINRNVRTIEVGESITVKGYFWGQFEIDPKEIKAYKLREIRRTKYSIQDYNMVLYDHNQTKRLEVTQGNYKTKDWDSFVNKLTELKIEFLGKESLATQWRDQWTAFKSRFVKYGTTY